MDKIKQFCKQELSDWKKSELIWLCIATLTILTLSLYWKDSAVGIIAAITGVLCVVLTGKGKMSSYIFGMVKNLSPFQVITTQDMSWQLQRWKSY